MQEDILSQFAKNVRELRKAKGWSQEELAKRAGLHRTYIGSIERSKRDVSLISVEKLAKAFDVPMEYLLRDNMV